MTKKICRLQATLYCLLAISVLPSSALANDFLHEIIEKKYFFQPLKRASNEFRVGQLVIPGFENLGTVEPSIPTGSPLNIEVGVEILQKPSSNILIQNMQDYFQLLEVPDFNSNCTDVELLVNSLERHYVQASSDSYETLIGEISKALDLANQGSDTTWLFVSEVIKVSFSIKNCPSLAVEVQENGKLDSIVVGYRGTIPTLGFNAAGKNIILEVLQLFELEALSASRRLNISGIAAPRDGMQVGWIDRVRLGTRNIAEVSDEDFFWIGKSTTGPISLWSGRFHFRFKDDLGVISAIRDIFLTDKGKLIEF